MNAGAPVLTAHIQPHRAPRWPIRLAGALLSVALAALLWGLGDAGPGTVIAGPGGIGAVLARMDSAQRAGMKSREASAPAPAMRRGLADASAATRSDAMATRPPDAAGWERAKPVPNPLEQAVAAAYLAARRGHGSEAEALLDSVLAAEPGFRPALAVRGILDAGWSQPAADVEDAVHPAPQLQPPPELAEEATLRLAAALEHGRRVERLPGNLLQLAPEVHTVLAADIAAARLYVFRQFAGILALEGDYYLSTGSRGPRKRLPGDQRTPIGIYGLEERLPDVLLPALAGHAAWPLSFPNRWDLWQGRLGSGI